MDRDFNVDATYEGGVLRPDEPLSLPDHARVRVTVNAGTGGGIHVAPDPGESAKARALWKSLATRGVMRLQGWHPSRDEMHDRNA